jgi:AraC-like DNA-binding protein
LPARRLKRVLDHIDRNIDGEISIDELAALAEQGSFHFQRCFKQSTAMPLHRYVIERRVERACEFLATTHQPDRDRRRLRLRRSISRGVPPPSRNDADSVSQAGGA